MTKRVTAVHGVNRAGGLRKELACEAAACGSRKESGFGKLASVTRHRLDDNDVAYFVSSVKECSAQGSQIHKNGCFTDQITMNSLRQFPLGKPFPNSPHAVISSLPSMADVRGYEEGDPRVLNAMELGYPRFVVHAFVERLINFYLEREGMAGRSAFLIAGRRAADDLLDWAGGSLSKLEVDDAVYLVVVASADTELAGKVGKFIQHTGCGISSRHAEDLLFQHRLIESCFEEPGFKGNAGAHVEQVLAEQIGCRTSDVLVCSSGMNAFYAGFRAIQEFQLSRGRTGWIQLGWLYLDSGCVLKEFLEDGETLECVYDVYDVDAVLAKIASYGDKLSAVVVECPSNPLIRVCEVHRIAEAVRAQGGVMIIDPTIASVFNVEVLPCADLLVTSLTKYASIEGDVMIGALALNKVSPYYGDLVLRTSSFHVAPYRRDLGRLAAQIDSAPEAIARMNENTAKLCEFLKQHPAVGHVYCAGCSDHVEEINKTEGSVCAVVSIELNGELEKFYDTVRCMKGPSFGTRFTLLCPFMYLAHYDLVTSEEGRSFLAKVGIDPELVRISVGTEAYGEIEAVLAEALDASLV